MVNVADNLDGDVDDDIEENHRVPGSLSLRTFQDMNVQQYV